MKNKERSKKRFIDQAEPRANEVATGMRRLKDFKDVLNGSDKQKIVDVIEKDIRSLKSSFPIKKEIKL